MGHSLGFHLRCFPHLEPSARWNKGEDWGSPAFRDLTMGKGMQAGKRQPPPAAPGMEIQAPGVAGEKEIQDLVGFLALHTVLDKDPHLPTWT